MLSTSFSISCPRNSEQAVTSFYMSFTNISHNIHTKLVDHMICATAIGGGGGVAVVGWIVKPTATTTAIGICNTANIAKLASIIIPTSDSTNQ
jgi:hypothetical protein